MAVKHDILKPNREKKTVMCDRWETLRVLFVPRGDGFPEIHFVNMAAGERRACIDYLVRLSIGFIPHFTVPVNSYENLLEAGVRRGPGEMLLLHPAMPVIGVDLYHRDRLTLSYATGSEWSYVGALAWLNTLYDLHLLAPGASCVPDRRYFTASESALLRLLLGRVGDAA